MSREKFCPGRFATEIILRHEPGEQHATATILPHVSRGEEERLRLRAFQHSLREFSDLPGLIEEAAKLMGVRGYDTEPDAPAFSEDVLRLELVGNTRLHLTIVDLPGLISVSENEEDVRRVRDLVDLYLENSRTIILAVVPASSDIDTQGIIQRARHFDKDGLRTVGIITKPDLINAGTESRVARLAKNLDGPKLNLGFFLLKNPTPAQLEQGITLSERCKAESEFFSTGAWKSQGLDPSRVGVDNLRSFLQDLLDSHIERELPKVRRDVRRLLNEINEELVDLGIERSSPSQTRIYLTQISSDFHNLVKDGVEGAYGGRNAAFFQVSGDLFVRLRAAVHMENEKFASYMRQHGEKRKVVSDDPEDRVKVEEGQIPVTDEQMTSWVRQIFHQTRGQELPGNHNHVLLTELFHAQSGRWGVIGRQHVHAVVGLVSRFVDSALAFVIKDLKVRQNLMQSVTTTLDNNIREANKEFEKLWQDEILHPITYNHYYTDNIQKARHDRAKKYLKDSIKEAIDEDWNGEFHISDSPAEIHRLVTSLQDRVIVDMTEQACLDARTDLAAYYKVAIKTFIDNVCRQVIERHILAKLPGVFDPVIVSNYTDDELLRLGGESTQVHHRRVEARQLQKALERSLRDLEN
ncbi:uncharacterized protein ATNIH1004_000176 [Aspergillus tanneri]|uniref:GED domain-containing protein n=1 Tax=Aspergillus tanneri TaxID=1220188 RepID=A0A5M9MW23_9EURO|nr:uncharacterized protein ATNIH1004_000176 [Aspergillus tanneri]KAA8651295.1 hypothetical protein ATNIH1004_000176 [Aspergillus tanneri]